MTDVDRVTGLVPFVHVADLAASRHFYRTLGLDVTATHPPDGEPAWLALSNGDARLRLAKADTPIDGERQGVLFYLYVEDLTALRERLIGSGWVPGEIRDGSPGPRRELPLCDPDGYLVIIAELDPDEGR